MKSLSDESEQLEREEEAEEFVFEDKEKDNWDINKKDEKKFGIKILLINLHINQIYAKVVIKES